MKSFFFIFFIDTEVEKFKKAYDRYPAVGAVYGFMVADFIKGAYEKAGSFDTEKFIDAMEGMTVDTPVGPVTMRAYDHQAMLPMFMGTTRKVEGYDHLVATDIVVLSGEDAMPTVDEIKKARGEM